MRIAVKLFAAGRELAGAGEAVVEVGPGATAGDVRRALGEQYAALAPLAVRSLQAVNAEYAADTTPVTVADEVALIPPVSGG
jgi:molybdopterin converting factor small subunit